MTTQSASRNPDILIQQSTPTYALQMEELFRLVFDPQSTHETCEECIDAAQYTHHMTLFPEGQFIALERATDRVVGVTTSMRCHYDPAHPHLERWYQSVGEGWLTTHIPDGEWMYGVETVVHADYRGAGIGRLLMEARRDVLRKLNLRGMIAGSIPISYYKVADTMPIEDYVKAVEAGKLNDTNLSKQLHMGFKVVQIIPNYVVDVEPRQYGLLIVWENPDYRP
jgi:GNAT superfamily N-acetyltransferase